MYMHMYKHIYVHERLHIYTHTFTTVLHKYFHSFFLVFLFCYKFIVCFSCCCCCYFHLFSMNFFFLLLLFFFLFYFAQPLNFPRRKLQTERSSTLPICQRCKQVFLKRQNYTQHVAQSSCNIVEYDFKCSVCPMSFMSNEELQTHEQLHRSHRYFCQKYCGKFYETIDECEQHEYGQHEYEMYKCNVSMSG